MSDFLMTTWEGSGTTPPLMSVAGALVERGHGVRVLADPTLREEVEAVGASHISWKRAPHRTTRSPEGDFIRDWAAGPAEEFARMRDRLAVGPAAAFAADVREELERQRPAAVLTELLLFGPLVAAEAVGIPSIVLNPTINVVPAPGVPPFGAGLMPASTEAERLEHGELSARVMAGWDEALPALNAARAEHGLAALEHVLDQGRSAARVLVMSSRAFDFTESLPPVVKHVGPRLDDPLWAQDWTPPVGADPLVLVALSAGSQGQDGLLRRIVEGLGTLPVRALVTTGHAIDPATVPAPENVKVVRAAPHREVLREAQLVITHCGHGTTLKALAAGVPIVGLPMGRDQLDVAARVVHAGAGVRLDQSATPTEIAAAVREILRGDGYRAAAERIARIIAEETESDLAVAEIEAVVAADGSRAAAAV